MPQLLFLLKEQLLPEEIEEPSSSFLSEAKDKPIFLYSCLIIFCIRDFLALEFWDDQVTGEKGQLLGEKNKCKSGMKDKEVKNHKGLDFEEVFIEVQPRGEERIFMVVRSWERSWEQEKWETRIL